MRSDWQAALSRWRAAGLVNDATIAGIEAWEQKNQGSRKLEWPVLLALVLGGFALGAGVLLFVAANWAAVSPGARFSLVLCMAALFHIAAAFSLDESPRVRSGLHALGTVAFGAGLALTGQIFHLPLDWQVGLALWTGGAWVGWLFLRDVPHTILTAIATPWWLASELSLHAANYARPLEGALLTLALSYLTAAMPGKDSPQRHALMWLGIVGTLPPFIALQFAYQQQASFAVSLLAVAIPLVPAVLLRGPLAWNNALVAAWILVVILLPPQVTTRMGEAPAHAYLYHLWSAMASLALIAWGWAEARAERINLGVIAFAITVLAYYVSNIWDKLGRSLSLILLGLLLLGGGWLLERLRRRITAAIA
jgi:uncharacterized membrane protein